jgi:hypothetical protein
LAPLAGRLLVVTGDQGPGARRVQAGLNDLPQAVTVVLEDYAGRTWADIATERGDSIGAAMQEFLMRLDVLPRAAPPGAEGVIPKARIVDSLGPPDRGRLGGQGQPRRR